MDTSFMIPYYIFEEIIKYIEINAKGEKQYGKWEEIKILINMATINETLSEEQANFLKEKYNREKAV